MALITPRVEDRLIPWRIPLGQGAIVHVSLDDCEYYVYWLFDYPERSDGIDLEVAIDRKPARYVDTAMDDYFQHFFLADDQQPAGYNAEPADPATMSLKDNFSGSSTMWKDSAGNRGIIKLEYRLLNEIHPNRTKTAEVSERASAERGCLFEVIKEDKIVPLSKIGENKTQGRL
ncbi:hypothetical protein FOMG_19513 [Fusarium oxysporum f. sp. melonis 26406]|uniref:Uncharacterized protein n=1 Tax=Fusarium oxysporum f. sp. melonis 26406 TaxID=1089452 RepID=W9YX27_FUSOX|nr:hypothetical protein FOMG_19513 [Fusarium oxysporum f. sp. melonis 26406]